LEIQELRTRVAELFTQHAHAQEYLDYLKSKRSKQS
jgi:hypothetical protein